MLNPLIRSRRLTAEFQRLQVIHNRRGLIAIEDSRGTPPDFYVIRYMCRGILRIEDGKPVYGNTHRVLIQLTSSFPTTQPLMRWLTPLFHPNVSEGGEAVCVGSWFPAKTLDQLVLMLGEMIQYKNYASHDPLRVDASLWAMQNKHLLPVDNRLLLDPTRIERIKDSAYAQAEDIRIRILGDG